MMQRPYFYPERAGTVANDQLATKLVTTICQSHKTFVDVGAHIGSVISEVGNSDSTIKIVAIEAILEKIVQLRRKFPFVELHDCATEMNLIDTNGPNVDPQSNAQFSQIWNPVQ
jgi:precorrin-6B methylase 2